MAAHEALSGDQFQQGLCGTYATALIRANPTLKLGTAGYTEKGGGDASGGWSPAHHFAHDDTHAYDSLGTHSLPYHGIHNQFDYSELGDEPEWHGLPESEAGPSGPEPHIKAATEHARRLGQIK